MEVKFPLLTQGDIQARIQSTTYYNNTAKAVVLLYKDARVDMRLFDEVFGCMNWQRRHEIIGGRLYCTVEVWDAEKGCWVSKSDVGTESNTEAEKGQSSDSFKRACTNWGCGRELYTAPNILIPLKPDEYTVEGNRAKPRGVKFFVKLVGYNERNEINALMITDRFGNIRYSMGEKIAPAPEPEPQKKPVTKTRARKPIQPPKQNTAVIVPSKPANAFLDGGGTDILIPLENAEAMAAYTELQMTWEASGRKPTSLDSWIARKAAEMGREINADFLRYFNQQLIEAAMKKEKENE